MLKYMAVCCGLLLVSALAEAGDAVLISEENVTAVAQTVNFPVQASYRKAVMGAGYVLVFNTTIKEDIPAILTVKSSALGTVKKYQINLAWNHVNEFGHLEGIVVYPHDQITLENNNYISFVTTLAP